MEKRRADRGVRGGDEAEVLDVEVDDDCESSVDLDNGSDITSFKPTCLTFGLPSARFVASANAVVDVISHRIEMARRDMAYPRSSRFSATTYAAGLLAKSILRGS